MQPLMPTGARQRILVTGATGFAGGHLAEALLARGNGPLFGLALHADWPPHWRHLADHVSLQSCDLTDCAALEPILRELRPEQIYHLAGFADNRQSFQHAEAAWAGNLTVTQNLYAAVERWGGRPRILFVGSALVYGDPVRPEQVFDETSELRPTSPYAASKAAADLLSYQKTRTPGLDIVRARPLNHIGPRQLPQFAVANFARQLVAIQQGRQPPVVRPEGNLRASRDLTDVRDVVQAYILLMEKGRSGEVYNVASGTVLSMQTVLDRLIALGGIPVEVQGPAHPPRAAEVLTIRADAGKLRRETGWAPRHALDQTLADTLAYWANEKG
jgi:GDP-4-dehydro-6-deoxy-D-mannose reductase